MGDFITDTIELLVGVVGAAALLVASLLFSALPFAIGILIVLWIIGAI